ncbi:MAG: acetylxylan esterase [Candidatus Latescibacteria bacterium]|nr:acetylxylan esterase [Candidatus Latescibacterota bacterium]
MDPESRREELYGLLGDLPDRHRPIAARTVGEEVRDRHVLEKLVLDLNGIEEVPAYFVRPRESDGPWPAMLYNHAHGGDYVLGKDEFIDGRNCIQDPPYAELIATLGMCGLCIDAWNFCERRGRAELELFKEMLWNGQVLWGLMVYDSIRALDYLSDRPDVDADRIATLGLSMGSTMAWWTAALDTRIKVTIDLCCLTDFQELIASRGLDGHGIYYYVPGLLKQFTTSEINGLIAPRAHLSLAGNYDRLTPPAGLDRIDRNLTAIYERMDAADAWKLLRYEIGHFETAEMRAEIVAFLNRWL